jgi:phosphate transport system permease protein
VVGYAAIPPSLAHGAYALGASKSQVVWTVILPGARRVGATDRGWRLGLHYRPARLDSFTVLPIQIWYWSGQPQDGFKATAAAAIIVLTMNGIAIFLRNRYQKKAEW